MLASQLQHLATVSNLARLDFGTAPLMLEAAPPYLRAGYRGAYCAGTVREDDYNGPVFTCELNGAQFAAIVGLYDDSKPIALRPGAGTLTLATADQQAQLRITRGDDPWSYTPKGETICMVQIERDDLLHEVESASLFSAKSMASPVLTGIRLAVQGTRLVLTASDGVSSIYAATLEGIEPSAPGTIVIQPLDFILGLKLMPEQCYLTIVGERLLLQSDPTDAPEESSAFFYTAALSGSWPDFGAVLGKYPSDTATKLTLPSATVRTVVTAAGALQAGNDIMLQGTDAGLVVRTLASDAGQYVLQTEGDPTIDKHIYDGGLLALIAKLGDTLTLTIPENEHAPTQVQVGHRRCWIVPKMS